MDDIDTFATFLTWLEAGTPHLRRKVAQTYNRQVREGGKEVVTYAHTETCPGESVPAIVAWLGYNHATVTFARKQRTWSAFIAYSNFVDWKPQ